MQAKSRKKLINELPLSLRPREKLLAHGADTLTNQELLAVILGSGYKKSSVLELAKKILQKFSLRELGQASIADLSSFKGIASVQACKIKASLELGSRIFKQKTWQINKPSKAAQLCTDLKLKKQEYVYALYLNGQQELIEKKLISLGNFNSNLLDLKNILAPAISLNSAFIILVHNHPSGDPTPSQADLSTTQKLAKAAKLIGIVLLDHLIISPNKYYSLKEKGKIGG